MSAVHETQSIDEQDTVLGYGSFSVGGTLTKNEYIDDDDSSSFTIGTSIISSIGFTISVENLVLILKLLRLIESLTLLNRKVPHLKSSSSIHKTETRRDVTIKNFVKAVPHGFFFES